MRRGQVENVIRLDMSDVVLLVQLAAQVDPSIIRVDTGRAQQGLRARALIALAQTANSETIVEVH